METFRDILQCPFDGTAAKLVTTPERWGYTPPYVNEECPKCGVKSPRKETQTWTQGRGHYSVEQQAIKFVVDWWNRRVDRG